MLKCSQHKVTCMAGRVHVKPEWVPLLLVFAIARGNQPVSTLETFIHVEIFRNIGVNGRANL